MSRRQTLLGMRGVNRSVLIVEDDVCLREQFAAAVRSAEGLELAGLAGDLPEGLALLERHRPDVLLVDLGLPSGNGIDLIRRAEAHVPQCAVMVVSIFADGELVVACIEAGALGYLLKDASADDIAAQIRLLCEGGSPISPAIARRLLKRFTLRSPADVPELPPVLSAQETSVLTMSAKGYNYEETAKLMGVSRHTVETYVKRIYRKLQVHSKTEAIYEARKLGLVRD